MNRLRNYLRAKEVAKVLIKQTESNLNHSRMDKNVERAVRNLLQACYNILIAQNCLVSLAFEKRKSLQKNKPKKSDKPGGSE